MRRRASNPRFTFAKGRLTLEVTRTGFLLWDNQVKHWVIDASTIENEGIFTVAGPIRKKRVRSADVNKDFPAFYPKEKK